MQVTNQVTTFIGDRQPGSGGGGGGQHSSHLQAALGTLWAHAVNTRLVLESVQGEWAALPFLLDAGRGLSGQRLLCCQTLEEG